MTCAQTAAHYMQASKTLARTSPLSEIRVRSWTCRISKRLRYGRSEASADIQRGARPVGLIPGACALPPGALPLPSPPHSPNPVNWPSEETGDHSGAVRFRSLSIISSISSFSFLFYFLLFPPLRLVPQGEGLGGGRRDKQSAWWDGRLARK